MTSNVTFNVTDNDSNGIQDDVDAIARIAYAEAANVFAYYKGLSYSDADAAKNSYGMVIDIIINRSASGSTETMAQIWPFHEPSLSVPENRCAKSPLTAGF